MQKLEIRASLGLGIVSFLRMLGTFMILPVLSNYGNLLKGANSFLIGVSFGIYGFTQSIFQIPFGIISDWIGRKKIIIIGLLLLFLGSVVAANSNSILGLILGRAIQGSGAISAPIIALLSDCIREKNRTKAMALMGTSFGISFAIAMLIGPFLSYNFGFHFLFWLTAILSLLSIVSVIKIVPSPKIFKKNEFNFSKKRFLEILVNKNFLKINFFIFLLHILLMFCFISIPIEFKKINFSLNQQWKIYFLIILFSFFTILVYFKYIEKKINIKKILIGCIIFIIISNIFLWKGTYFNHFGSLIIGLQLFFCVFNLLSIILPTLISKISKKNYKGTAIGIYTTTQFLGMAIGGAIGGIILHYFSIEKIFLLSIMISILWIKLAFSLKLFNKFKNKKC